MAVERLRRTEARHRSALWVLGALLLCLISPLARPIPALAVPPDPAVLAAQVEPGLVQITTVVDFQKIISDGTGIVLSPDGQVLTNHHIVQGANSIKARSVVNGQTFDADVIGYARGDDIAVLQLRGAFGLPVAPLGDSNLVAVGEPVLTIGNANGTGNPLTHETGVVTNLNRTVEAEDGLTGGIDILGGMIESSTNLRSGDSGGALVNSMGRVVGLNAAATLNVEEGGGLGPAGQGFAIPINRAMDIANQIRNRVSSPSVHIGPSAMLGVGISAADDVDEGGLPVRSTLVDGPADQAGVRPGDIITMVDGVPVDSANALTGLLDHHYPGDVIELHWIDQAGTQRNAKITLFVGPVS
jgi:S1-C subfamily serine protease